MKNVLERRQVRAVEAGIDPHEIPEAAEQESRANDERDSERHLADDQSTSHAVARASRRRPASAVAQRESHAVRTEMQKRRHAKDYATQHRETESEREHSGVDGDRRGAWKTSRAGKDEHFQPDAREDDARRRSDERQHETLGQELADQSSTPGAQGRAHRKLSMA